MGTEFSIIPNGNNTSEVETSIASLNEPLSGFLESVGLPIAGILTPIDERRKVIFSLGAALELLPYENKVKAIYLSKFSVCIINGLFDGALNYLWDETVRALRRLVISYDLQYFFSVAQSVSSKYKNFSDEKDLESISEFDLLEVTKRMGLISEVAFKQLENINYMRNHASAAHPNDNELTGFKMVSFVEDCIKYAINAKPDHSVIKIKELSKNIRTNSIPATDFSVITDDLLRQPQRRLDDFLISIFGLYCDANQAEFVYSNIEEIAKRIWGGLSEDTRYIIGSKYGVYRKNADVNRKEKTQRFLEVVGGLQYKDEESLSAEILEKLQDLRSAHFGFNNFYNEYVHAKSINDSMPKNGIPNMVRVQFVKIICQCYIGNGCGYREGVDESAVSIYENFINRFNVDEIRCFILLFSDSEFTIDFDKRIADKRLRNLCEFFYNRVENIHYKKMLEYIKDYNGSWEKLYEMGEYKNMQKNIK